MVTVKMLKYWKRKGCDYVNRGSRSWIPFSSFFVFQNQFRVQGAKASRQIFLFEKGLLIAKKREDGYFVCKGNIMVSAEQAFLVPISSTLPAIFFVFQLFEMGELKMSKDQK